MNVCEAQTFGHRPNYCRRGYCRHLYTTLTSQCRDIMFFAKKYCMASARCSVQMTAIQMLRRRVPCVVATYTLRKRSSDIYAEKTLDRRGLLIGLITFRPVSIKAKRNRADKYLPWFIFHFKSLLSNNLVNIFLLDIYYRVRFSPLWLISRLISIMLLKCPITLKYSIIYCAYIHKS